MTVHKPKSKAVKDKEWKLAVRARDVVCQMCPPDKVNKILNAAHLIPKEFEEFRWDLMNGILSCVHHHKWGKLSIHKNPIWFCLWLIRNKPNAHDWAMRRIEKL